jgi:hypothetical protein
MENKKEVQFIDLQYFNSIYFYYGLNQNTDYLFSSSTIYQKSLHPNRLWLAGPNNLLNLSIPLLGGRNQKMLLRDVRVVKDENWQRSHWRSIHDAYRKSPWFDVYAPGLEELYHRKESFLADWNLKTLNWAFDMLKLNVDILSVTEEPNKTQTVFYKPAPLSKLPESYPVYQQVFMERHGFIANLCILDLLFCCGPMAGDYLNKLSIYLNTTNDCN